MKIMAWAAVRIAFCSLVFWGTEISFAQANSASPFDPATGYRISQFRAPVDRQPIGARPVGIEDVQKLRAEGALLVDVRPLRIFEIKGDGDWLYSDELKTVPGAAWLPVVAWGTLQEWQANYLKTSLGSLTNGDFEKEVIVFCRTDCWLSWNAARRFSEIGYRRVFWFADGIDGWEAAGGELVTVTPHPVLTHAGH